MLLQLLCVSLFLSVVAGSDDTLYFKPKRSSVVICPDKKGTCPDGSTCCLLNTGKYGCCPLPKAVCCSDHLHCCPSGYTCDPASQRCNKGALYVKWHTKTPATPMAETAPTSKTMCPGGMTECPQNNTCCQIGATQGNYGCCPVAKGVCCADRLHCCPANYKCDTAYKFCVHGDSMLPWLPVNMKTAKLHVKIGSATGLPSKAGIVCPGGKARCPKATTCCKLKSGSYGCCPMVEATCCTDHIHCCPKGSTCNLQAGTCDSVVDKTTSKLQKKFSAHSLEDNVICPDSKSTCPSGSTCCKMQSGEYGCCPMPKAVCCSDHLHCCPSGTTCDVAKGACNRGMYSVPWQKKTPALKTGVTKGNSPCPGGGSCPGDATCCKMPSGKYGCCPYAKAVCCKDLLTCCPHGTICNPDTKKCDYPGISTSWSAKNTVTLSGKVKAATVVCPDKSTCPKGSTCCHMKSGGYGCCPMDQAVCCSDHVHCCPHRTTCDVGHQTCRSASDSIPWSVKLPARPVNQGSTQVVCPDKKSLCPSGQTCCLLKGGVWGCCPMPKAVCCKDGLHCCPESTTCDITHGRCNSNSDSLSISWTMVKRIRMLTSSSSPPLSITCPDKSECPGVSTCCQQSSGHYGCCPLLNGTCCADKLHCCPSGFKCKGNMCVRQGVTVPMSQHSRHASKMPVGGTAIKCPDSNMECPDGTTCCKILKTKKYGCCPKPNAVCCADGIHCCPQGMKCDEKAGRCVKAIPWATKVAARQRSQNSNSVICPDKQHECPDMNTCCRLSTGEWGCCPLPKAVCCTDGKHCCPNGYTCDPTTAMCNPGGNMVPRAAALLVAAVQGRYRVKN